MKFAAERLQGSLPPRLLPAHAPATEILCRAFAHLFDTFDMHPIEARHYEALEHLLGALLALTYRRNTAGVVPPDWLIETRELITRKCAEGLTAEAIASEIGYSPGHLSRLFRHEAGISLKTFYDAERARLALEKIEGADALYRQVDGGVGRSAHIGVVGQQRSAALNHAVAILAGRHAQQEIPIRAGIRHGDVVAVQIQHNPIGVHLQAASRY